MHRGDSSKEEAMSLRMKSRIAIGKKIFMDIGNVLLRQTPPRRLNLGRNASLLIVLLDGSSQDNSTVWIVPFRNEGPNCNEIWRGGSWNFADPDSHPSSMGISGQNLDGRQISGNQVEYSPENRGHMLRNEVLCS